MEEFICSLKTTFIKKLLIHFLRKDDFFNKQLLVCLLTFIPGFPHFLIV